MANRGQVVTNVRENLEDQGVTFFTYIDILESIQDGYDDIAAVTGCIQRDAIITLDADTTYHDFLGLVPDFLGLVAVYNLTTNRWVEFQQLKGYDRIRIDWETWQGSQCEFGAISNFRYVCLIPRSSSQLQVFYRATAPKLLTDSDTFLIHLDEQTLLEQYATADLLDSAEEYNKADMIWSEYFADLVKYSDRVHKLALSDYIPVLGGPYYAAH